MLLGATWTQRVRLGTGVVGVFTRGPALLAQHPTVHGVVRPGAQHLGLLREDPLAQIERLLHAADEAPKSVRWKIRARVGERKRWYRLPDEEAHD